MTTGDVRHEEVPRAESNLRWDLDLQTALTGGLSLVKREVIRSLLAQTIAVAGAPVGELWNGSITVNTAPDTIRIDTALFVGVDADGQLLIKPAGTVLSTVIVDDSTDYQVYVYTSDVAQNSQVRRKLPSSAPFVEFPTAVNVGTLPTLNFHLRSGGAGSIVADDTIGGVTTVPLCFLGIANNTGGTVTFTPAVNRLQSVVAPTTLPTTNAGNLAGSTYTSGSIQTLRDMVVASLSLLADAKWAGATAFTQTAANNRGAYTGVNIGVDRAGREITGVVTIGDRANGVYGSFDRDDYATDDLLMVAAIAEAAARQGTNATRSRILIKSDVVLNNFAANVVFTSVGNNHNILIEGEGGAPGSVPQLALGTFLFQQDSGGFSPDALEFRNLSITAQDSFIQTSGNLTLRNCSISRVTLESAPLIATHSSAATIDNVVIDNCSFTATAAAVSAGSAMYVNAAVPTSNWRITDSTFASSGAGSQSGFLFADVRANWVFDRCSFAVTTTGGADPVSAGWYINAASSVASGSIDGRRISNCKFRGSGNSVSNAMMSGVSLVDMAFTTIDQCQFWHMDEGIRTADVTAPVHGLRISDCLFMGGGPGSFTTPNASFAIRGGGRWEGLSVTGCEFREWDCALSNNTAGTDFWRDVLISQNRFYDCSLIVKGSSLYEYRILGNHFMRTAITVAEYTPLAVEASATGEIHSFLVDSNTFNGFSTDAVSLWSLCIEFKAFNVRNVVCSNNGFRNLQNIAWDGANSGNYVRIIGVLADTVENLRLSGNTCRQIANSQTLGTATGLSAVVFSSISDKDEAGAGGGVLLQGVQIDSNIVGTAGDHCKLHYQPASFRVGSLRLTNNSVHFSYDLNYSELQLVLLLMGGGLAHGSIAIQGNTFYADNNLGAVITNVLGDPILFSTSGVACDIATGVMTGNSFVMDTQGWDPASDCGIGANNLTRFTGFCFQSNVARLEDVVSGTTAVLFFDFSTAPDEMSPALPGTGVAMTNCVGIQQA